MSDRYKQVRLYQNFKFYPTSPVDILKGAIYIDNITNNAVFQLKLVNTQDKYIKSVYITVVGYDELGKELENKQYSYLDLNIRKGVEFGIEQLKELSNNSIRNINVTVDKVIYVDNEVWENQNTVGYDRTNLQCVDDNMLFIASRKATEQRLQLNSIYYPIQNEKYWTCICGTYNSNNNHTCYKCNSSKDLVFSEFCKSKIESEFTEYIEYKQEKNNIKKTKNQKMLKVFIILFILSLIVGIFIYNTKKSNILISLDTSLNKEQEQDIKSQIERICNTTDIQYTSKDEALQFMKEKFGNDVLKDYDKENNIFPSQYKVKVKSSKSSKITNELMNIKGVKAVNGDDKTTKTIINYVIFSISGILLICIVFIKLRIHKLSK